MISADATVVHTAVFLSSMMLTAAALLALARMLRGPSIPDRVVALDLMGLLAVGAIALYCVASGQPIMLDAAIIVALMAFLGTIGFARYVERSGHDE